MACQGYSYEDNPGTVPAVEVNRRKNLVRQFLSIESLDRHILSGVTLQVSFRQSIDDFAIIYENAAKFYKVKIKGANLYVTKMTLNDDLVSANEKKTLLSIPAPYPYLETITKCFLLPLACKSGNRTMF